MSEKDSFFIATYGCQMNDYDSSVIENILTLSGYSKKEKIDDAGIIIVNGCAVREHAEERALGYIKSISEKNGKRKKIIIAGCLAKSLTSIPKNVSALVSSTEYHNLADIILSDEFEDRREFLSGGDYSDVNVNGGITINSAIMKGCNNFCSYCIVPYLRGKESSISPDSIIRQIERSRSDISGEIMLIGQNVNAYNFEGVDFVSLLNMIADNFRDMRVRFITSHPNSYNYKLVEAMKNNKNVCKHIHLPVQSGSTRMLNLMHRGYTAADYIKKVDMTRTLINDISITTDIMVGLPYESEDDFELTLKMVKEAEFDDAFMYKYSPRRMTLASICEQIDESERLERLQILIETQKNIKMNKLKRMIGKNVEVLIEGNSKKNNCEFYGRDDLNRSIISKGNLKRGKVYNVRIESINGVTPVGAVWEEL